MSDLPIPVAALEDCGAILGRRGTGKSNTMTVLWEHELDAGHRTVMIDPKGDRWGIRLMPDGSKSRFDVPIFGGPHADYPIAEDMGEALAKLIAGHDFSCLIDLSELHLAAQHRFMTPFAEALLKHNRAPITLFMEEADQFANQDQRYQPAKLLHHVMNLIMLGRQRGIIMWMATQRPAKLSKNLLSQVETFIGMGVRSPNDRVAFMDWFKGHSTDAAKKIEETIGSLKPGEAWVWVGNEEFFERVTFSMAQTFDSGRRPKHGETVASVKLNRLDHDSISAALGDMGIAKADEPEPKPGKAQAKPADDAELKSVKQQLSDTKYQLGQAEIQIKSLTVQLRSRDEALAVIKKYAVSFEVEAPIPAATGGNAAKAAVVEELTAKPPKSSPPAGDADAGLGAERKILSVLASVFPKPLTEARWSTVCGMKRTGGTWKTYKSRLRTAAYIMQLHDGRWAATAEGVNALGGNIGIEFPPAGPELVRFWAGKLGGVGPMCEMLIDAYPKYLSREILAQSLKMAATGGTFKTYLSRLSGADLIEKRGAEVRLTVEIMENF